MKGQAKKDFEKWCENELSKRIDTDWGVYGFGCGYDGCETEITVNDVFNDLPPSMQYGVIVDWFDSVGIVIEIEIDKDFGFFSSVNHSSSHNGYTKTRTQARQKAIDKAVEIYNKRL